MSLKHQGFFVFAAESHGIHENYIRNFFLYNTKFIIYDGLKKIYIINPILTPIAKSLNTFPVIADLFLKPKELQ